MSTQPVASLELEISCVEREGSWAWNQCRVQILVPYLMKLLTLSKFLSLSFLVCKFRNVQKCVNIQWNNGKKVSVSDAEQVLIRCSPLFLPSSLLSVYATGPYVVKDLDLWCHILQQLSDSAAGTQYMHISIADVRIKQPCQGTINSYPLFLILIPPYPHLVLVWCRGHGLK